MKFRMFIFVSVTNRQFAWIKKNKSNLNVLTYFED